ncbi:MAG: hypothetical protein Q8N15_00975 [Bacillota bacterium]|nr:hypothetical protein [Bacillota bacterium]
MKKLCAVLFIALTLICTGCVETVTFPPENHANAYMAIIEDLYECSGSLDDLTYIGFDFSNLDADVQASVAVLAEAFCKEHDQTYLAGTIDELLEQGYITGFELDDGTTMANGFPEGVLFRFDPVSVTESEIVCEASRWRGSLSAIGSTYQATYVQGVWQTSTTDFWMS